MALEIKLRAIGYIPAATDRRINFDDVTGAYDPTINVTGYGGPNPERTDLGIFIEASAHTIISQEPGIIPIRFALGDSELPSDISQFYLDAFLDGNYALEYVGLETWVGTIEYFTEQAIFFNEIMYIANVDIAIGETDPSVNPNWSVVPETGTGTTISTVINNPDDFDKGTPVHFGRTIVLSTMVSDRRYVDMVTAKEKLLCFYDGTLDQDAITNYRVLLYGAKANAFVECDINGVYLLRACNDIYQAAKIKCSNLS